MRAYARYGGYGRYGQDPEEAKQKIDPGQILSLVQELAPGAGAALASIYDPKRQAELLRVQLQSAVDRGASAEKILNIQIKLNAAEERLAKQQEGEASVRRWRGIGQGAAVLGTLAFLGVSGAGIYYLITKATQ